MPASLRVGGGDGGGGGHGQGASTRKHASQKEGPSSWRRHLHPWAHDLGAELRLHNSVPPPPHSLTLCTQVRTPTAGSALCTALAMVTVHTLCPHQPAHAALGCCSLHVCSPACGRSGTLTGSSPGGVPVFLFLPSEAETRKNTGKHVLWRVSGNYGNLGDQIPLFQT